MLSSITASVCCAPWALAQQAPDPQSESSSAVLVEIVVTARKQQETLQDAPLAVTAFTANSIAERGITDVNTLAGFTPGLSFSQAFGRSVDRPVMRGQSNVLAGVQFGVESGAAYFLDGVYYPSDVQALDFNSLERVEVIKGPQSALYGRNTYSGAINFVTRNPTDELEGRVKVLTARHDEHEVAASFSGPLIADRLGFRIGARWFEYGGEYVNHLTGRKVGDEQTKSIFGSLHYSPAEDVDANLKVMYREDRDGPLALFLQPASANNCYPGYRSPAYRTGGTLPASANDNQYYCGVIAPRPDLVQLNTDAIAGGPGDGTAFDGVDTREVFSSLNVDWNIAGSDWILTSLSGYRDNENLFGTDSDHSDAFLRFGPPSVEPLFANTNRNDTQDWSSELRLATPQDARVRGLVGVYYYHQNDVERDLTYASPIKGADPVYTTAVRNEAAFGLLAFDVADTVTVTGELRYAKEKKSRAETNAAGSPIYDREVEFSSTTPRLTVDWQLTDDLMLYGVYAEGNKPGGLNGTAGLAIGQPSYDQEQSDNYEIGAKATWLGGRLRTNLSLYFIDATHVQLTTAIPGGGSGAITSIATNQGAAEIRGAEIEVTGLLARDLTLSLTYSYNDSEFKEGCDDFQFVLKTGGFLYGGVPNEQCSIVGNRLPMSPEHQASATLTWYRPITANIAFSGAGTLTYESSKFVQVHNLAETGDATLLGLRLGLEIGSAWEVVAFGRNLTDEDSVALATRWFDLRHGLVPLGTPAGADTGSPRAFFGSLRKGRTYGLELVRRF